MTSRSPLAAFSALTGLAAIVATVAAVLRPYPHAAWLVAYLLLVGFAAQGLLARGQTALVGPPRRASAQVQAALWNAGVVAVPVGVFADARLFVVLGGLSLLLALVDFWLTAAPGRPGSSRSLRLQAGYVVLIAVMAISTFVGIGLAWHRPWL